MADTRDGPAPHPVTRELASGPNYAAISTSMPSGHIQTQYIWVGTDGERLNVNTEPHRQKFKDLERDPRITLAIRGESNPYRYAEVRGRVVGTERGQSARDQIDELSQAYDGKPYPAPSGRSASRSGSSPSGRPSPADPDRPGRRTRRSGGPTASPPAGHVQGWEADSRVGRRRTAPRTETRSVG